MFSKSPLVPPLSGVLFFFFFTVLFVLYTCSYQSKLKVSLIVFITRIPIGTLSVSSTFLVCIVFVHWCTCTCMYVTRSLALSLVVANILRDTFHAHTMNVLLCANMRHLFSTYYNCKTMSYLGGVLSKLVCLATQARPVRLGVIRMGAVHLAARCSILCLYVAGPVFSC